MNTPEVSLKKSLLSVIEPKRRAFEISINCSEEFKFPFNLKYVNKFNVHVAIPPGGGAKGETKIILFLNSLNLTV